MEESVTDPDYGSRNLEPLSLIPEDQEKRVFGYEHRQILSVKFSPHNPDSSTSFCLPKVPQSPKISPPAGNHMFKHLTVYIKAVTLT